MAEDVCRDVLVVKVVPRGAGHATVCSSNLSGFRLVHRAQVEAVHRFRPREDSKNDTELAKESGFLCRVNVELKLSSGLVQDLSLKVDSGLSL